MPSGALSGYQSLAGVQGYRLVAVTAVGFPANNPWTADLSVAIASGGVQRAVISRHTTAEVPALKVFRKILLIY